MQKKITLSQVMDFFKNLRSPENIEKLRSFFMSKWYPVWIAFSVLLGRMLGLELYFVMVDFVLVSLSLLVCDTLRPVLPNLISFLYRISLEHGPGVPYFSTYYTGTKMVFFVIFAALFFVTLIYFFIKNKLLSGFSVKKTPLFIPLCVLSLAFLMGGIFTEGWSTKDLGFSLLQVFVFFVVFLILYFGLRKENVEELCNYFTYICAVTMVILIVQVVEMFISVDAIIVDGAIDKQKVFFGWGISNTAAAALTALIPICFLGAIKSKRYSVAYFVIATLGMIAAIFTLSRNAFLVGGVFYTVCLIISCFLGEHKKMYRIITLSLLAAIGIVALIFGDELAVMFTDFSNKGLSDNGRYYLWRKAWDYFKESPVFGIGFFSFDVKTYVTSSFTPRLAHNTILQLLSSMGIFGLAAYMFYRVCTFIPFFNKPTREKAMLLLSIGVLLGESLLDNFIFWFAPTFIYNIAIVLACMYSEAEKKTAKNADEEKTEPEPIDESEEKADGVINADEPVITL